MTAPAIELVALALFVGALIGAAFTDFRHYLIPNRYPAAIALAYALYAASHPLEQGLWGAAVGFAALILGAALLALGVMGGGDAKLLAAVMLWAGPSLAPTCLMVTAFAGAAIALVWLTPFRRLMPAAPAFPEETTPARADVDAPPRRLAQPLPYGIAIAVGGFHVAAIHAFN
jgi:prepilin peptidase CpaA